jgi:UDP-glucuronate 4-epimerase
MKIAITGISGMIGFHLVQRLQLLGHNVFGVDNFNSLYYDASLKRDRAKILKNKNIEIIEDDFSNIDYKDVDFVIHLAAHAGVRVSMDHPSEYIRNNVTQTQMLIESLEKLEKLPSIIYASSSCVQNGQALPWKESDNPAHQNNYYAMTKRMNECQFMLSKLPVAIGLRFFTVYGTWGRPDMALFTFTKSLIENKPIPVFNNGDMLRDFTYVDDICQGIEVVLNHSLKSKNSKEIYNLGYGQPVSLMDFIEIISKEINCRPNINYLSKHPADAQSSWADISKIKSIGFSPSTPVEAGVKNFINWYKSYYLETST